MVQNYFNLRTKARKLRNKYYELTLEEKIDLLNLHMVLEAKDIKSIKCHTKAEQKKLKKKKALIRKHNEKNKIQSKGSC